MPQEKGVDIVTECSYQGGRGQNMFSTVEGCVAEIIRPLPIFLPTTPSRMIFIIILIGISCRCSPLRVTPMKNIREKTLMMKRLFKTILRFFQNLSQPSGSRPSNDEVQDAFKKLRAIRYNAGLIQICYLMTVLGGVPAAIKSNPKEFQMLTEESKSVRRRVGMIVRAMHLWTRIFLKSMSSYTIRRSGPTAPSLWKARKKTVVLPWPKI